VKHRLKNLERRFWLVFTSGIRDIDAYRVLDTVAVIVTIPFWVPLLGLIALAIRISEPGAPIFYSNPRTGLAGEPFEMLKFRSMVVDAESQKADLRHLNEKVWPEFKITDDPRITPIGRWIRKYSLDEIPQLINVLRGEMALVGPRPSSAGADRYEVWQTERLEVRQGITGFWQAGDRVSDFEFRVRLDLRHHVRQRSLLSWFSVVLRTIPAMSRGTFITR